MTNEKLFTVAGTATNPNGTTKARFANDFVARVKILSKAGCTNINLVELPEPMTKLAALQYLTEQGKLDADASYAVANKLAEKSKAVKGFVKLNTKPDMSAIRARKKEVMSITAEQLLAEADSV